MTPLKEASAEVFRLFTEFNSSHQRFEPRHELPS